MKLLFIHQGFPGQYVHILEELAKRKNNLIYALGLTNYTSKNKNIKYFKYEITRGNADGIHPWVVDIESKVIRGEACTAAAEALKRQGFCPDIICGHPGWGEMLFIKDIWPKTPILQYQEYYYQAEGFDSDFDPEFDSIQTWRTKARTTLKTINPQLNLINTTWSVTPTQFQKSSFPLKNQKKISVIHDGINTEKSKPMRERKKVKIADNKIIDINDPVITFVNRRIEPYRGCHTFIRAIPLIQKLIKGCKIIIVGENKGVSYGRACPEGEWSDMFFKEIKGNYRPEDVYLVGTVDHESFTKIIQRSDAHIYLTYPFVLSWSLLEAMSCGAPIIASRTAPVMEVIEHEKNGLLTSFFDIEELSNSVARIVEDKELARKLSDEARKTILAKYELKQCVQKQIELIDNIINKRIS